mgnify:FL=1
MALNKSELNSVGNNTLKTILQLVRYDIPVLVVGKSSIGKSYTIIEVTEKWRLPSSILYIGSEKPENIEGLAKLISGDYETKKDDKGKTTQKGEDILKFLKPYWFPNSNTISTQVANGQRIFDNFIKVYDKPSTKFSYSYSILHQILICLMDIKYPANENSISANLVDRGDNNLSNVKGAPEILNSKAFEFKRSKETEIQSTTAYEFTLDSVNAGRDDIRDMCMYLCTLLGYGNYWLVLDELDKVSENDTDKYAPLLHIVRERTLKSWTMKEINDKKGMPIPLKVDYGSYRSMADLIRTQISKGLPLLDCRIIGIANATNDIEEALFRRFCQIIMRSTMSLYPPNEEVNKVMECVDEFLPNRMDITKLLRKIAFLDEVNLQWQYSFLPKMLNKTDTDGNFIFQNFNTYFQEILRKNNGNFASAEAQLRSSSEVYSETSWGMIWRDNYMGGQTSSDEGIQALYKDLAELYLCLAKELYLQSDSDNISAIAGSTKVGGGTLSPLMQLRREILETYAEQKSIYFDGLEIELDESYGQTIGNPSALGSWTKNALSYIEASNIDEAGNYDQIAEVGDRMIPFIYQILMRNYKNDKTLDTDSFNAQLLIIDEFFNEFLNKQTEGETHSISADKEQTEKLMFGETKKILKGMKPLQQKEVEKESLYGRDVYDALSFNIYKRFYLQGVLTMFIESVLNENESYFKFIKNNTYEKQFLENPKVKSVLQGYYDNVPDSLKESAKGQRFLDLLNYLNART